MTAPTFPAAAAATTPDRPVTDGLLRLAAVLQSRQPARGGDPEKSYVARLLHKGPDAFLKKIGEEATEVVMAAKDAEPVYANARLAGLAPEQAPPDPATLSVEQRPVARQLAQARAKLVAEMADLWFHSLIALTHYGLSPQDVADELARREGLSGFEEKALRKAQARDDASPVQG